MAAAATTVVEVEAAPAVLPLSSALRSARRPMWMQFLSCLESREVLLLSEM
jgi:hypothetical protein